jgi:dTDP-4-dehydrorhamnose reductase
MLIHVLGSNGMLGCYVSRYLKQKKYSVKAYIRTDINAALFDSRSFKKNISSDDIIINCIGLLKPNIKSDREAVIVNREFPLMLDSISCEVGCKLINFSSDCVYSGERGCYTEVDECDALDIYGITKRHEDLKTTVIRLSFIGEELLNKQGLLEFALKNYGKSITGYTNCMWNGVTGLEIAKIIDKMIRKDGIGFWSGVRNVFSDKILSKCEVIQLIDSTYNLNLNIIPTEAKEISGTSIKYTLDRSLSTVYNKIAVPSLEEMLYEQRNYIYEN